MSLGENIYRLRSERNMSQGALADALEVSRQSVSKWENNSAIPELDKLLKMSELFGVTLDQLVGKDAPVPPAPEPAAPESPMHQAMPTHRILGIILLCFSLIFFLMMFWGTNLSALLPCLVLAAPFFICGMICLKTKRHTGLYCLLTFYLFLWLPMGIFPPNYIRFDLAKVLQAIHMIYGGTIILMGWNQHKKKNLFDKQSAVWFFFAGLALSILITYLFMRFPSLLPTPGLLPIDNFP